jgi:hypothetical protein
MRMADQRGVWGVITTGIEKSLKPAGRTAKVIDRFDL